MLEGKVTDLSTKQPIAAAIKLAAGRAAGEGRLPLPGRRRGEGGCSGPLGAEEGAGRLGPRGRRGGRLRAEGRRLCPVRRSAPVAILRLRPRPPRHRLGAGHRRRRQAARGGRCAARQRPAGVRRPLRVAARIHLQDRRRGPLPGRAGPQGDGHDLAPQAGLLPARPGPADRDAQGRRRAADDEVRQRPRHGGLRRQGAARRVHREASRPRAAKSSGRMAARGTSTPGTR